jgi:hypothetical protein
MLDTTPPDRLSPDNIRCILTGWMERHNLNSFPWITDPTRVEVGVCAPLFSTKTGCICGHRKKEHSTQGCGECFCPRYVENIYHVGKLDLLGTLQTDPTTLCPVDHKTTGKIDGRFIQQFTLDSQMTGYLYDASHIAGKPITTCFINAIELSLIPTSTRKCPTHGVPYAECGPVEHLKFQVIGPIERTPTQIKQWRDTAVFLARRFHQLCGESLRSLSMVRQEGTFNSGCAYCEFREWCLADRDPKQVPHMFHQAPWSPVGHVFGTTGITDADPVGLYIDNSTLKSVAACSTQALMRYGLHWTAAEQSAPLAAGTAVHAALERWFRGGMEQDALKIFEESYATAIN